MLALRTATPRRQSIGMFCRLFVSVLVLLAGNVIALSADESTREFDSFIFVLLVRPTNAPELSKEKLDELQIAHLANIRRLASEGKLLKAGPVEDYSGQNARGIFIFNSQSKDEVEGWVRTDPLVKMGRLAPEIMKWSVEKGSLK